MSIFKKAKRSNSKLKLALVGPSGSGKTMSALRILRGLGCKKVAVIDTENGSSELYADVLLNEPDAKKYGPFQFDVAVMSPPYLVSKYISGMNEAAEAEYDAVIVDSLTHAWAGEGGILQRKEQLDQRGGNSFTNWGKMTPEQELLKNAVLHTKTHLICTMRTKTEYVVEQNDKGKQAPRKVGLAPIQRDGFEYEFDAVFEIAMNHEATPSKDRTHMFDGQFLRLTEKTGEQLKGWLDNVSDEAPAPEQQTPPQITKLDRSQLASAILAEGKRVGWEMKEIEDASHFLFKKKPLDLTINEMSELYSYVKEHGGK